ncbi:hypothetical protein, partial [Micromonospora sp. NPDC050695]|uniref:hypothetical protein n=1 Tax=Micromonospora sp. NPDC050695 TaxID=3154938 RepID=UPI0033D16105
SMLPRNDDLGLEPFARRPILALLLVWKLRRGFEGVVEARPADPPGVVVFVLPTARRIGAQLRVGSGPHLDEVRFAAHLLLGLRARPPRR